MADTFLREVGFYWKNSKIPYCATLWDLGVTYTVHLGLVGKHEVNFLLALIEIFHQLLWLRHYERILVKIVVFERRVGHFEHKFQGESGLPPTTVGVRKLESVGYYMALFA